MEKTENARKFANKRKIPILIVGHGDFGHALLSAAEMMTGPNENLEVISLELGESIDSLYSKIKNALDRYGGGALILIDVFGGSPAYAVAKLLREYREVEAIAGANLPMLLEALISREEAGSPHELADLISNIGRESIINIRKRLRL
ncbi:MAG: PTS sugar transporter subunit IIA [Candidatus Njordarchaeales archaeon]|mgnify:CR=1 FL=1